MHSAGGLQGARPPRPCPQGWGLSTQGWQVDTRGGHRARADLARPAPDSAVQTVSIEVSCDLRDAGPTGGAVRWVLLGTPQQADPTLQQPLQGWASRWVPGRTMRRGQEGNTFLAKVTLSDSDTLSSLEAGSGHGESPCG